MPAFEEDITKFKPKKRDRLGVGMSHPDIYRFVQKYKIEFVTFRIYDILGRAHELVFDADYVFNKNKKPTKITLRKDFTFDGSSIEGFTHSTESGLLFSPSEFPITYVNLNAKAGRTLIIETGVSYPSKKGGGLFEDAPSTILLKVEQELKKRGMAMMVGPEPEYFVRRIKHKDEGFYDEPDILKTARNSGYSTNSTIFDQNTSDFRSRVSKRIKKNGVNTKFSHKEVVEGFYLAQCENELGADLIRRSAANIHIIKYAVQGESLKSTSIMPETIESDNQFTTTFNPKPIKGVNGSGMHINVSFVDTKTWKNLFAPTDKAGKGFKNSSLSETGYYALGGLMAHAKALQAFANPSMDSYLRIVPDSEAPTSIAWGPDNRTVAFRIPLTENEKSVRIEFRVPDPSANAELLFSAMAMAMLDGIDKKINPIAFVDKKNVWKLSNAEQKKLGVEQLAGSLKEAINNLSKDNNFLTDKGVFTKKFIDTYSKTLLKRAEEQAERRKVIEEARENKEKSSKKSTTDTLEKWANKIGPSENGRRGSVRGIFD